MLLKDHTTDELQRLAVDLGGTPRLARQLQSFAMKQRMDALPDDVPGIKRVLWSRIKAAARVPHLQLVERAVSPTDGFAKYLFKGEDDAVFEAVRIPLLHRPGDEKYVVCVSSQVGCAAKCAFCETGKLGFKRNLAVWEIVDQVVKIQSDSALPVRGVVFMGMGEPFLNYARVMRAAQVLSDPSGLAIDAKKITISTVGVAPMIRRFTQERRPYRLIASLHTSLATQRDELVPMNQVHDLESVVAAMREYQDATGKRVIFAWTMMAGVNMSREHVLELARLTKGMKILLDFIPVNDPTGRFRPPSATEQDEFLDIIRADLGCPTIRRYSGGADVHGACGMLAGRQQVV